MGGVVKKLIKFFQPNSLHFLELVDVCCVSHIECKYSSDTSTYSCDSHFALWTLWIFEPDHGYFENINEMGM